MKLMPAIIIVAFLGRPLAAADGDFVYKIIDLRDPRRAGITHEGVIPEGTLPEIEVRQSRRQEGREIKSVYWVLSGKTCVGFLERRPAVNGFGMWFKLRDDDGLAETGGFSWEWYEKDGDIWNKLQAQGDVDVNVSEDGFIQKIKFRESTAFRMKLELDRENPAHVDMLLVIEAGSTLTREVAESS